MEIFGHDYGFLYSVGAQQEMSDLCPGQDLTKLPALLDGTIKAKTSVYMDLICILSKWHEKAEHARALAEGREYTEKPLTQDLLMVLDKDQFAAVQLAAFKTLQKGKEQTVEAESAKKNGNGTPSALS